MLREPTIPIFLWVTTAILLHIVTYGGSERVVTHLEARKDLKAFVSEVRREAQRGAQEIEVALLDDEPDEDAPEEPPPDETPPDEAPDPEPPPPELPELPGPPELPDEPPEDLAAPAEKLAEESKPEVAAPQELVVTPNDRRVAVVQQVEDPNQPDNPDAAHIADEANHVAEETRASITNTEQDEPEPVPGGAHQGPELDPGNSDESRVAQAEDTPGEAHPPDPEPAAATSPAASPPPPPGGPAAPPPAGAPSPPPPALEPPASPGHDANEAAPRIVASPEGAWNAWGEASARAAEPARPPPRRLPPPPSRPGDLLGYGRLATTPNGVNLNLSPTTAVAAIGSAALAAERKQDGERRRSEHRGSWSTMGIERWRASIENYVASVKPGNQTALNTARVPFASYLNHIHNRLHPIFADSFLRSLDALPGNNPLNRRDMATHLEIVVDGAAGRLVRMGVTKTSGVTAFDVGALEAVSSAAPFGRPPSVIVSPDGNVYLHWEFHREPALACSTFNARPFILKVAPQSAPPRVAPPRRPPDAEHDERQGAAPPAPGAPPG